MKHIYLLIILFGFIGLSNAQDEQFEGVWVLESIFDFDILLENPSNSYVTINNISSSNIIDIHGVCGETYESEFNYTTVDNSIEISQTSWFPNNCPEDTTGWEVALSNLFSNPNTEPKELTYIIINDQGVDKLQLSFTYLFEGIPTGTFGNFTRLSPPSDLLDEWYLHSLTTSGVQHDNYIGGIGLEFTDSSVGYQDYFSFEGGTPCQFNSGEYRMTSSNSLYIPSILESASCGGDINAAYTQKYINVLSHNYTYSGDLTYEIVEIGNGFQLTLTNTFGDIAVFKTYLPTKTIFKTWYSYSTETTNGIIYPSSNDSPTLTLSKNPHFDIGYQMEGSGGCNEFNASYNIYNSNENEFGIFQFEQTLVVCEENEYEPIYFSVLNANETFSYELQNNGETLVLTNNTGDILTFGSNPSTSELLGEWYLNQIEVNDVIHPNYYNNENLFELEFIESSGNVTDFDFFGTGPCDSFGGISTPSQNNIAFNEVNFTLLGPCSNAPEMLFENIYFSIFESQSAPFDFSYVINGENDEQTLTLTNPVTGDQALYRRTPNTEILTRTWYLNRIEIPGNPTIEIPNTQSPSLTITSDINPNTLRTTAFGNGECNAFMSDYEITLNNGNSIKLLDFSPTLGFCESDYEDEYFSIIGDPTNNFSEFEITNNGTVLNVTDLLGARLVFGDEPLSVTDNEMNTLQISLKNNPVNTEISLSINQTVGNLNYQIYSIDGKLITEAILNTESINVEELNSGLYFIRFFNNSNQLQTLKFIKQ